MLVVESLYNQKYLINENVKAIDKETPVWYNKTRFSHF